MSGLSTEVRARLDAIIEPLREERERIAALRKTLKTDYEREQKEASRAYNAKRLELDELLRGINAALKPLEGGPQPSHRMVGRPTTTDNMPKLSQARRNAGRAFVQAFLEDHENVSVTDVREHFVEWGKGGAEALLRILYEEERIIRLAAIGPRGKKLYKLSGQAVDLAA